LGDVSIGSDRGHRDDLDIFHSAASHAITGTPASDRAPLFYGKELAAEDISIRDLTTFRLLPIRLFID
jgi:hypothetical protein